MDVALEDNANNVLSEKQSTRASSVVYGKNDPT